MTDISTLIAVFNPIASEMAKIREHNDSLSFDVETPDGEKAARSHIYTLRKIKTRIAAAHKEAKADALLVSQTVDRLKRELTADVDGMIAKHEEPIKEREARIAKAKADEEARILREKEEAERKVREEQERKAAELAAKEAELKAREEAQARKEREAQIAAEAEAKAKRDAEEAIRKAKEDADRRVVEERMRAEKAAAEERARVEREARENEEATQRRVEDRVHRVKVEDEASEDMCDACGQEAPISIISDILDAIIAGKVRHVSIRY